MRAAVHWRYSIEEYLRLERASNVRHELLDGEIFAMGGGTREHAAITAQVLASFAVQLRGWRWVLHSFATRVRVRATGLVTYPDVSIAFDPEEHDAVDPDTLVNPIVLVEITSPQSEAYDRGAKLDHYVQIPSLREVAIVSHREPRIDVWRRDDDGWTVQTSGRGESAELASVACSIPIDDIYVRPGERDDGPLTVRSP